MWEVIGNSYVNNIITPQYITINDFHDGTLREFHKRVIKAYNIGQMIFPIEVASDGGDANILAGIMSIMEEFRDRGMKFSTCVTSRAMSAGAFTFLFGDHGLRFIGTNASLMIHTLQLGIGGRISEVKRFVDFNWQEQGELLKKISKNLKKNQNWLEKELAKRKDDDWYVTAKEALDLGFASQIKIPVWRLEMIPQISYS